MLVDARCDDVNTIDIRDRCQFADYFIVSTARSHQHVFTAANAVMYKVCCIPIFMPELHPVCPA